MKLKHILILLLVVLTSVLIVACSEMESLPDAMSLDSSIRAMIKSKGADYDFINDEEYMAKMHQLANLFIEEDYIKKEHYRIGNLDEDNIPELVVFRERNPENVDDQGYLEVYGFITDKYQLLDRVPMNYDNTNYNMVVGKLGPDQNGILMHNQVGSQSGITYGFVLNGTKLKNILNENKINLVSINTYNQIRDIDKDGVLEFSIYAMDPESLDQSIENSDKIEYWYKWDGKDGARLVKYSRFRNDNHLASTDAEIVKGSAEDDTVDDSAEEAPNDLDDVLSGEVDGSSEEESEIFQKAKDLLIADRPNFKTYLEKKKDSLSKKEISLLLDEYFDLMTAEAKAKNLVLRNLLSKYKIEDNSRYLFDKYELTLERLNDPVYLKREKVLTSEPELKNHLIGNLKLGYILVEDKGSYSYTIDYQSFLNSFGDNIYRELRDYYRILAQSIKEPYMKNGSLLVSRDKLANRLVLIDNFRMTYPYSEFIDGLDPIYNDYLTALLYGSEKNPVFDGKTNPIDSEVLQEFKEISEKYIDTNLGDIVAEYIQEIEKNNLQISEAIREKLVRHFR